VVVILPFLCLVTFMYIGIFWEVNVFFVTRDIFYRWLQPECSVMKIEMINVCCSVAFTLISLVALLYCEKKTFVRAETYTFEIRRPDRDSLFFADSKKSSFKMNEG